MRGLPMTLTLLFLAVLGSARSQGRDQAHWKLFVSKTQHFSVLYPSSWNRLLVEDHEPDHDTLDIINFPDRERARGVVIKEGGASIDVVGVAPDSTPFGWHSVDDWIRYS